MRERSVRLRQPALFQVFLLRNFLCKSGKIEQKIINKVAVGEDAHLVSVEEPPASQLPELFERLLAVEAEIRLAVLVPAELWKGKIFFNIHPAKILR
jgi:hypothetical protein